ncbi:MAG TPA: peptide-methionine (S)-S-oxide reductase MsrA [Caulobacteraceae bacterium]|jgi:peptide-methionine (S)-S-oxide reductase|nr:peptide-methionine (S)-S-oxide reductase MsrA [Caulobacteraceae bacterium]
MKPLNSITPAVTVLAICLQCTPALAAGREIAVFGGGCFWTLQKDFERIPGVMSVRAGYDGGTKVNPSFNEIHSPAGDGYVEAVQVSFDPAKVSYAQLVEDYWRMIDPFDASGQACDRGPAYRSLIFFGSPDQQKTAQASKAAMNARFQGRIAVQVTAATPFHAAPSDQQDFAKAHAASYGQYSAGCGRDTRLKKIWGKEAR